jgi:hypothetical protein
VPSSNSVARIGNRPELLQPTPAVKNGTCGRLLQHDEQEFVYQRFIAPTSGTVRFAKALDRSVTGSMNDLVVHAKLWLTEDELSPFDVGFKLNDIPFSSLKFVKPREAFKAMAGSVEP